MIKHIIKRIKLLDVILLLVVVMAFASRQTTFGLQWNVYLYHFAVFAPFGVYLYFRRYSFLSAIIIVFLLSAISEISQKLFFHRVADIVDVFVDSLSAAVGWLLVKGTVIFIKRFK